MGLFAFFNDDAYRLFIFIKFEPDLLRRKVDGTVFKSLLSETLGEIIEDQELLRIDSVFCFDDLLYFLISKTMVRMNDSFAQPMLLYLSFWRNLKDRRKCELVFIGPKRA